MTTQLNICCPLCKQSFYQPKVLEQCMHSFCSQCICTHVKPLLSNDNEESTLDCPVCKTPFIGPVSSDSLVDWLDQLPSDPMLRGHIPQDSSDPSINNCEPCTVRKQHSKAIQFCKDCNEKLCSQCADVHKSSKGTRSHVLVNADSSCHAVNDTEPTPKCEHHANKEVEYYCTRHDELICSKCAVLNHRVCDILELDMAIESLARNASVEQLKSDFERLQMDIKKSNQTIQEENNHLKNEVQTALKDVEDKRKQVNASFDRYKNYITEEVRQQLGPVAESKVDNERISIGIANSLALLTTAINSGNHVHVFMRSKALKRQVEGSRNVIKDIQSINRSPKVKHSFSPNVTSILNDDTHAAIGSFHVKCDDAQRVTGVQPATCEKKDLGKFTNNGQTECLEKKSENKTSKNEKLSVPKESPKVVKGGPWGVTIKPLPKTNVRIKTTVSSSIILPDGSEPFFAGAAFLDDDRIILTDVKQRTLVLLDGKLKFKSELKLERMPRKVTVVSSNEVAVSLNPDNRLVIIKVDKTRMTIRKTIKSQMRAKCVIGSDNRLFMSSYRKYLDDQWYLTCYNLEDGEETQLDLKQEFYDGVHMALFNSENQNHLLFSCRNDDTLKCYTEDGKEVFSYKMLGPAGVDIDKYGNIFVASMMRNKLLHLSPEGILVKTLIVGNLFKPMEVRMNQARDKILVTQYNSSEVHILGLTYQ